MTVSQKLRKAISRTYHIYNKGGKQLALTRAVDIFIKADLKWPDFPCIIQPAVPVQLLIVPFALFKLFELQTVLDFTINDLNSWPMAPSHITLCSTSSSDLLGSPYLLFAHWLSFPVFQAFHIPKLPLFHIHSSFPCSPIHSTQVILVDD